MPNANKADFRRAESKQAASQVKVTAGLRMATLCIPIASDSRRFICVLVAAINSELSDPGNIQTYRHKVAFRYRLRWRSVLCSASTLPSESVFRNIQYGHLDYKS